MFEEIPWANLATLHDWVQSLPKIHKQILLNEVKLMDNGFYSVYLVSTFMSSFLIIVPTMILMLALVMYLLNNHIVSRARPSCPSLRSGKKEGLGTLAVTKTSFPCTKERIALRCSARKPL